MKHHGFINVILPIKGYSKNIYEQKHEILVSSFQHMNVMNAHVFNIAVHIRDHHSQVIKPTSTNLTHNTTSANQNTVFGVAILLIRARNTYSTVL
jgi:hypothetical protein